MKTELTTPSFAGIKIDFPDGWIGGRDEPKSKRETGGCADNL